MDFSDFLCIVPSSRSFSIMLCTFSIILLYPTFIEGSAVSPKPFEFNETIPTFFSEASAVSPKPFEFNETIPTFNEAHVHHVFNKWMVKHGRNYSTSSEMIKRREIFKKNVLYIQKFNSQGNNTYRLAINKFADMNNEDLPSCEQDEPSDLLASEKIVSFNISEDVPDSFDWREHNAVSPVRDQGRTCGSCWAFAAIGAMESLFYIKGDFSGEMTLLSPQQLIDCDTQSDGCSGGLAQKAFRYVGEEGIATEDDYPYEGVKQSCDPIEYVDKLYIDGYTALSTDEWSLRAAVSRQPVVASIRISEDFRYYGDGIYQGACGNQGHAVLIVGYGEINEEKYWIVKNSWGLGWGMDGYFWMRRNQDAPLGHCGLATRLVYPIILDY